MIKENPPKSIDFEDFGRLSNKENHRKSKVWEDSGWLPIQENPPKSMVLDDLGRLPIKEILNFVDFYGPIVKTLTHFTISLFHISGVMKSYYFSCIIRKNRGP